MFSCKFYCLTDAPSKHLQRACSLSHTICMCSNKRGEAAKKVKRKKKLPFHNCTYSHRLCLLQMWIKVAQCIFLCSTVPYAGWWQGSVTLWFLWKEWFWEALRFFLAVFRVKTPNKNVIITVKSYILWSAAHRLTSLILFKLSMKYYA